jgi:hypothetical protein
MFSGRILPLVSGRNNDNKPARTDRPPNTINGNALPKEPSTKVPCKIKIIKYNTSFSVDDKGTRYKI